jgi:hypothetical protein
MPNNAQQTITASFTDAARGLATTASASDLISGLVSSGGQSLPEALTQATQVITAQTQATSANTDALGQNTTARGSSAGSTAASVVNTVSQFLGGGLSLMPLVSIFSSLFGGGSQQPAPLTPYTLPPSLNLEATSNYQNVVYGENGLPRAAGGQANPGGAAAPAASAAQQITVQVQAMDSQSFLDHSTEIAQAVRQAMLNMNPINDVVTDL